MGPGLSFEPPTTIAVAFQRIDDMCELHAFWLPYERRAVRRLRHPDDRALLRMAISKTEDALRAVTDFLAHPAEEEASAAGMAVYRASINWDMLRMRSRSRRTSQRASVWIDSFGIWSRTLSDASPYACAFDEDGVWWEELMG
jgi:hypothetical protein